MPRSGYGCWAGAAVGKSKTIAADQRPRRRGWRVRDVIRTILSQAGSSRISSPRVALAQGRPFRAHPVGTVDSVRPHLSPLLRHRSGNGRSGAHQGERDVPFRDGDALVRLRVGPTARVLVSLGLGLAAGVFAAGAGGALPARLIAVFDPVGTVWV